MYSVELCFIIYLNLKYIDNCDNLFEICLIILRNIAFQNKKWNYVTILHLFIVDVNVHWFVYMFICFNMMLHLICLNMTFNRNWLFISLELHPIYGDWNLSFVRCSSDFFKCLYFIWFIIFDLFFWYLKTRILIFL
jgi:hypothetical protein